MDDGLSKFAQHQLQHNGDLKTALTIFGKVVAVVLLAAILFSLALNWVKVLVFRRLRIA
ncbi:MAG: hypothetical protein ABI145_12000 [Steroidobacteraceae bacterium]